MHNELYCYVAHFSQEILWHLSHASVYYPLMLRTKLKVFVFVGRIHCAFGAALYLILVPFAEFCSSRELCKGIVHFNNAIINGVGAN